MPIDNWFILALIMIFSSIIFCAILPMIIRLIIARHRHRRYRLELQEIAYSTPEIFPNVKLIYPNASHEHSIIYSQLPFIDDLNKEDETFV